jgi:hypothetical protein
VREIRAFSGGLSVYEELPGGGCEGRLFYRMGGRWAPPLPAEIQSELGRTLARSSRSIARSSTDQPAWLLGETDEPWRL